MNPAKWFALLFVWLLVGCSKTDDLKPLETSATDLLTQSKLPNIILIMADDIGYEIPTYTGGESYSTPNIDRMAGGGMRFTQAYTSPLCSPSRTMLLTAKYNFRNYTTWGRLDTAQKTIANLLKLKGYATCVAGKWQFDGGDAAIRAFGFDKYLVTNPFKMNEDEQGLVKCYKDPEVYERGAFWPANRVAGKYGEDLIRDYMFTFMDSVKPNKPFFIYYAPNLVHDPFCPTPDDPEFAAWDPLRKPRAADTVYFPSMVKYHDKIMGQLLAKLESKGIAGNTLIFWLGDNGTSKDIHSRWNGQVVRGGKSNTSSDGTHVPLLAYMPGKVVPGVNNNLISLVDFMSTIGKAAQITIPSAYGTTDGVNFYNQLFGSTGNPRTGLFCHFVGSGKNETNPMFLRRWMQDQTYKQYDSLPNTRYSGLFFNIITDPAERYPISRNQMTAQEKKLSNLFMRNMAQLH